ncbi:LytR/AlgR family response regulator transcription factor [Cellvibrio sp. ARAG 10.3]|jgi:two-component system response regulator AlgR|uniref:LytR/AlgR family response regulator transcription factor n=1 Tax=Cellvibrio sp. ARAG 10.3 TaxID=3451358 RepID=UPI003F451C50
MDVLIVDDEPLARQRLARMLDKLDGYDLVAEAENGEAALAAICKFDPDIVLLDVRMPGEDGLSVARRIGALDDPPAVIFCTAFDQYALDAFGTEAVGYLLKPVKSEQLLEALTKAQRLNKVQRAAFSQNQTPTGNLRSHISAKTRRGVELIPLDDVRYFIADHKYVTVYHVNGEHLLDETLKELEEEFSQRFLRIHRNALVSVKHIEAIERTAQGQYQVRLSNTEMRPIVSRRHVGGLKALLKHL